MIKAFEHRSGRVISAGRVVLASIFFLAVWVDPQQPARHGDLGYAILLAYVLGSGLLLVLTWSNWWIDYRTAFPAQVMDVLAFLLSIYFTEGFTSSFTSPFFSFFTFMLLSATLRWGWRGTAVTAVGATLSYAFFGLWMQTGVPDFDVFRFGRRVVYLLVLSFLIVWFGYNQQRASSRAQPRDLEPRPDELDPPIEASICHAVERTGGDRGVFLWWRKEEPWINVATVQGRDVTHERLGPLELGSSPQALQSHDVFLFDLDLGHGLIGGGNSAAPPRISEPPICREVRDRFDLHRGLAIPIEANAFAGQIFLCDVPGLCSDDLNIGREISSDIARAFDRFQILTVSEESAANRTRVAIARDLHDSVAQVLAGAAFRLEALRSWIRAGEDPDAEIAAIKQALRDEQRHVRMLIAKLRLGGVSMRRTDLGKSMAEIVVELRRQWGKNILFQSRQPALEGPAWLAHELHQLIREGVANAVRHGQADSISIELSCGRKQMEIVIADDGSGFQGGADAAHPWSIHERVKSLGGTLSLMSSAQGASLTVKLPMEEVE